MSLEQYLLGSYILGVFFTLGYVLATFIALEMIDNTSRALWPSFLFALFSWSFFIGIYLLALLNSKETK